MAQTGDSYTVPLKSPHLNWGEYRNSTNREFVSGEAYIPIPKKYAKSYNIFNSNYSKTGLGYNLFYADSTDGFLKNVKLLAQGSNSAGNVYAKQFSVEKDLKKIGAWYKQCNASENNYVRVTWTSSTSVLLEII